MRKPQIQRAVVALVSALGLFDIACGTALSPVSPGRVEPLVLAASVQALTLGQGQAGVSGQGVIVSVSTPVASTASARLEIEFADNAEPLAIPFEPATVRIAPNARGQLSTSVPDASDPRIKGRSSVAVRAMVTVRDDSGQERTVVVPLSITPR